MIVAYPALLLGAALVALARRRHAAGGGWPGFAAWTIAGALFTFSFLTGLSIGLLLLPLATVALYWAAWQAPSITEAAGFLAGLGTILVVVAAVGHGDPVPWLVGGASSILLAAAVAAAAARRHRP